MNNEELQAIVHNTNAMEAARYKRRTAYTRELKSFLPTLIKEFKRIDPDVRKIILFGSLIGDFPVTENSDIDLAVSSDKYLKLVAWALSQNHSIDVIDIDSITKTFHDVISASGKVLYASQ